MSHTIAIIGSTGQVGTELQRLAWPPDYRTVAFSRRELDLSDAREIDRFVADGYDGKPWSAIVNAAAYTAVDRAESDRATAWLINALAPAALAKACAAVGTPLLHVSTDYVFSGNGQQAWEVDDPVEPLNVYGASKLAGELAVHASGGRHVIVRTAWVVSPHNQNFVKTMLRLASERSLVHVVADQRGSPTSAADLARVLMIIACRLINDTEAAAGTFHFSNAGATDWAAFAAEIFRQSRLRGGPHAAVERISSADYPTAAVRPANSVLSHVAIRAAYGIIPRDWHIALGEILDELVGEEQ